MRIALLIEKNSSVTVGKKRNMTENRNHALPRMVRFMAETGAETPEQLKAYDRCFYCFDDKRSTDTEYVFIRTKIPGKQVPEAEF